MKRLGLIMMSVALMLGMAQCKKNNEVITSGVADGTRTITLKVSDNGSRISVNPNTGAVGFTKGDVIYAAYNGSYVSTLTHDGTDFTGTISNSLDEGSSLVFYFVGNKTPSATPTTSMEVSIFDQSSNYPVISAGVANEAYSQSLSTYTATLNNQCALVKFNVTTSSAYAPTIIAGVNDKVTITFAAGAIGTLVPSQERGAIKVAGGSGERWAILLPQDASGIGVAYSGDLRYNGTHGMIPEIVENGYLTAGIDVSVANALSGFTVAENTVRFFAPGNLQYIGSAATPYWKFADNQYDFIGGETGSGQFTDATNVDRDLFGWGTSGWSGSGATYYQPYDTDKSDGSLYGPSGTTNLTGTYANADWGVYNSSNITNGYGKSWYTLASWVYVLSSRSASTIGGTSNARFGRCTVNSRYGLMIFPDDFTWPTSVTEPTANINGTGAVSIGTYTAAQWTLLEANGAVFLPAAGHRNGASANLVGSRGYYWSSTASSGTNAYLLYFGSNGNWITADSSGRYIGFSVRLVCE